MSSTVKKPISIEDEAGIEEGDIEHGISLDWPEKEECACCHGSERPLHDQCFECEELVCDDCWSWGDDDEKICLNCEDSI